MTEYVDAVRQGFRYLLPAMADYIGYEFNKEYKNQWWDEILATLNYPWNWPQTGDYDFLLNQMDEAACLKLIDYKWGVLFRLTLRMECRAWAKELLAVRNIVSHLGAADLDQPLAERALDTMVLLGSELDPDSDNLVDLKALYQNVRSQADGAAAAPAPIIITGVAQPDAPSSKGVLAEGSLLQLVDTDVVQRTTLTRKISYGGSTVIYPVYRVRLDALFYNDQNDRIATWISRYEAENGEESLDDLSTDIYNRIIEGFIVESNPEALQKTQTDIGIKGQREPGVTLADGRIVDGNRRFTCLRRLQRNSQEPLYFETVIMEVDIHADRKQIKLLELAIQHGEEKKVDYDLIDYAVGTYRDVVQTGLLTAEEYAASANESLADVKKRIEIAGTVCDFLKHIKLDGQYHVAREYQVYSLFQEMMAPLKKLDADGQKKLKEIAFDNAMMHAIPDQRKFIRDIKTLIKNDMATAFFEAEADTIEAIAEKYAAVPIRSKEDVDHFAEDHASLAEDLRVAMEKTRNRSRSEQLKSKPVENVRKCMALMTEIDPRLFAKMEEEDSQLFKAELEDLSRMIEAFLKKLTK